MKYIYNILREYIKSHFNVKLYTATFIFVSLLLYFNFKYDIEDSYIDSFYKTPWHTVLFFLYQGIPYYIVLLFVHFFTDNKSFFKNKRFWIISLLGLFILAIDRGFYHQIYVAKWLSDNHSHRYIRKLSNNFISIFVVILPMYLIYKTLLKKEMMHFYGVQREKLHHKPYWIMLLLMVPLLILASYQPDFLREYPHYKRAGGSLIVKYFDFPKYAVVGIYELSYAFSFFIVEIIFRGYFIFALVKYLGKDVVLPMAVTYCVLHFGKPLGEAISSFFGGYLLGVIALKTHNIYGGIVIHIGIALLMELFAFIQLSS
ncbi:MAG: CPBP family intramembrane glutamic endopeptidase [Flavobacteriaceae bacterium]